MKNNFIYRKYSFDDYISGKKEKKLKKISSEKKWKFKSKNNNIQIIKNIGKNIIFIKKENKNNLGSLYELISGKVVFDINLLLFYLDTKDEVSIIDILVNKLYEDEYKEKAIFYLPQIIFIYLNKTEIIYSLENYLIYLSLNNPSLGLKIFYFLNSIMLNSTNQIRIKDFLKKIEFKRLIKFRYEKYFNNTFSEEKFKYKYLNKCYQINKSFYKEIYEIPRKISQIIRNLKQEKELERKNLTIEDIQIEFIEILRKLNHKIQNIYKYVNQIKRIFDCDIKNLFRGFILPSNEDSCDIQSSLIIVNILLDFSKIIFQKNENEIDFFNFDIYITFECVKIAECKFWDFLTNKSFQKNNSKEKENYSVYNFNLKNSKKLNCSLKDNNNESLIYNPFEEKYNIDYIKLSSNFKKFKSLTIKTFNLNFKEESSGYILINQLKIIFNKIFEKEKELNLSLYEKEIIPISSYFCLEEQINELQNFISIEKIRNDIIKKYRNINDFYRSFFFNNFEEAQKNYIENLASNCLFNYIINNNLNSFENLKLNNIGIIIPDSFGYSLSTNNNKAMEIFKLPKELYALMDLNESGMFYFFQSLIVQGIIKLRKYYEIFEKIIEITLKKAKFELFSKKDISYIKYALKERFHLNFEEVDFINSFMEGISNQNI